MRLFNKLRRRLNYLEPGEVSRIHQAFLLAEEAHQHQKRNTGEPYITHPVAVASILADMKMDAETIMAALLHDVIEDTSIQKQTLVAKFGEQVANLVDGVSKLTQIEFVSRAEAQAENFRKMVLAMSRDIRVIIVKLADRLHNMRTLETMPPEKKRRISRETLEIFAPIARRLGMREFSVELEELSFKSLYPHRYKVLQDSVEKARGNRKKILMMINKTLQEGLAKSDLKIEEFSGREKHLYSIYRKMLNKHIPFNDIMDVYAFRIITGDVDACYRVLGLVHSLFKPVPERFKDYIAIPKANGYQSLHTTLFGPYGLPIEIQIRTKEMDYMATSGVAAHWIYKSTEDSISKSHVRAQRWVKNLLELQQRSGSSLEFIESVKVDLFPDEVYVFTPKGRIMELPAGATAVDFAYAVHTDVGNACIAVKIDRQIAPLSTPLKNGKTVEIVTSENGRPNPAWLDFVVTSKARSSIRHYLKNQKRTESRALGRDLLKAALSDWSIQLKKIPEEVVDQLLKETKLKSFDMLFEEMGLGNRVPALVAQRISLLMNNEPLPSGAIASPDKPLLIKGTEGMVVSLATCCYPLPGDPIVGVLNAGHGVVVHRDSCERVLKLRRHPELCLPLRWAEQVRGEYPVLIQVEVVNDRGVLAIMALAISDADGNIEDISVTDQDGQHYIVKFKLLVRDRLHLANIIRRLRKVKQIMKITRVK